VVLQSCLCTHVNADAGLGCMYIGVFLSLGLLLLLTNSVPDTDVLFDVRACRLSRGKQNAVIIPSFIEMCSSLDTCSSILATVRFNVISIV